MEDTREHKACPSCGSALQFSETKWLNEGDGGDETVYELETQPLERAAIVDGLMKEGIAHRWEQNTDLVVADPDEAAVDRILDDVLGGDLDFEESEDESDDADADEDDDDDDADDSEEAGGEDAYQVMSALYLATGDVLKRWEDEDVSTFIYQTGVALATPTPFGLDEEVWAEVQSAARNASAALEIDSEADVGTSLKELHGLLQPLI